MEDFAEFLVEFVGVIIWIVGFAFLSLVILSQLFRNFKDKKCDYIMEVMFLMAGRECNTNNHALEKVLDGFGDDLAIKIGLF